MSLVGRVDSEGSFSRLRYTFEDVCDVKETIGDIQLWINGLSGMEPARPVEGGGLE